MLAIHSPVPGISRTNPLFFPWCTESINFQPCYNLQSQNQEFWFVKALVPTNSFQKEASVTISILFSLKETIGCGLQINPPRGRKLSLSRLQHVYCQGREPGRAGRQEKDHRDGCFLLSTHTRNLLVFLTTIHLLSPALAGCSSRIVQPNWIIGALKIRDNLLMTSNERVKHAVNPEGSGKTIWLCRPYFRWSREAEEHPCLDRTGLFFFSEGSSNHFNTFMGSRWLFMCSWHSSCR